MSHVPQLCRQVCAALILFGFTLAASGQLYPGAPVINNGGGQIGNVQVFAIFVGGEWSTQFDLEQEMNQTFEFLHSIVQSPYMDGLNQYSVGRGNLIGTYVVPTPSPLFFNGDSDAQSLLAQLNAASVLPQPRSPNTVYFIFLSPYTTLLGQYPTAYHFGFSYYDQFLNYFTLNYAVIGQHISPPPPKATNPFEVLTAVTSHELAEICTDPYGWEYATYGINRWGWTGVELTPAGYMPVEVCDMVEPIDGFLGNYLVSAYYSNQARGPAISAPLIPTTTKLKLSKGVIAQGSNVTATVTITPKYFSAHPMNGLLDVFDGTNQLGESIISSSGALPPQTFALTNLAVGRHHINAIYRGGDGYLPSHSGNFLLRVK